MFEEVFFQSGKLQLHGRLWIPTVVKLQPICVLVHPWSVLGGSAANTEPYAENLAGMHGIRCLTFELRGVGQSEGASTYRGTMEVTDVISACDFTQQRYPNTDIVLVGSSAGAVIAGSALNKVSAAIAYVGIGYTFGWMSRLIFGHHYDNILTCLKPKLFILGTKDEFTSVSQLQQRIASMRNAEMELIPNVGHFELETPKYAKVTSQIIAKFMSHEKNQTLAT